MTSRLMASAAVGGLIMLGFPAISSAQRASGSPPQPVGRIASATPGSIRGVVRDERESPVAGAVVTALGSTAILALTDRDGRFELLGLTTGSYVVTAHLKGYVAPPAQRRGGWFQRATHFHAGAAARSHIGACAGGRDWRQRAGAAAGGSRSGVRRIERRSACRRRRPGDRRRPRRNSVASAPRAAERSQGCHPSRRAADRRPPGEQLAGRSLQPRRWVAGPFRHQFLCRHALLRPGEFPDDADRSKHRRSCSRQTASLDGIAYVRLGAPVGSNGDWALRGALTQADISSWILAGSYATRDPAQHKYDVGWSYSTQRYDGGNVLARRDLADGSRNVGTMYGFDTFTVSPALTVFYGSRYARYDYLENRNLRQPPRRGDHDAG